MKPRKENKRSESSRVEAKEFLGRFGGSFGNFFHRQAASGEAENSSPLGATPSFCVRTQHNGFGRPRGKNGGRWVWFGLLNARQIFQLFGSCLWQPRTATQIAARYVTALLNTLPFTPHSAAYSRFQTLFFLANTLARKSATSLNSSGECSTSHRVSSTE